MVKKSEKRVLLLLADQNVKLRKRNTFENGDGPLKIFMMERVPYFF